MNIGICKLCLKEKELCRKSHIIPNHAYNKVLKDADDSYVYIDRKTAKKFGRRTQTGVFEPDLLCQDCETTISSYETYFSQLVLNVTPAGITKEELINPNGIKILKYSGVGYNYSKFKLCLLSILWKSSISSKAFFDQVSLGPTTEEDLRQKILNGNPGHEEDYPCFITLPALMHQEVRFELVDIGLIRSPFRHDFGNNQAINFLIDGSEYRFLFGDDPFKFKINSVRKDSLELVFLTKELTMKQRNKFSEILDQWTNI